MARIRKGDANEPFSIIFGGNEYNGGHWVLISEISIDATTGMTGIRRMGTLEQLWTKWSFDWRGVPFEMASHEFGSPTIEEVDLTNEGSQ